jgi:galactokinase/mevalonate kinase-like predicted kinase
VSIFDTCVITASDEAQAETFRTLIARRVEGGLYPREIAFKVYPDPPEGRVGSGGGTLLALLSLVREESGGLENTGGSMDAVSAFFADRSILVLHAGGESRRLPAYFPEGKLFAPVPSPSSSSFCPVILDHQLSLFLKYPWRAGEVLVSSGDVILDFNTELLDLPEGPICGFAAPASFERGSRHGVFAFDPIYGRVVDYYQKLEPGFLSRNAVIEGTNSCALDIGIVSLRSEALCALFAFADWSGAVEEGAQVPAFDLYLELLSACLGSLDLERYLERVVPRSELTEAALRELYAVFHPCALTGVLVKQSTFIHFGSLEDYPAACRELRGLELAPFYGISHEELVPTLGDHSVVFNSSGVHIDAMDGLVYAENCRGLELACGGDNILIGIRDLSIISPLPRGLCIDERRLVVDGAKRRARLVYARGDTFKLVASSCQIVFCGLPLHSWLALHGLNLEDLGEGEGEPASDLYRLALFALDADDAFLEGYWNAPEDPDAWGGAFRSSLRVSLSLANASTSAALRDEERRESRRADLVASIAGGGFFAIPAEDFLDIAPSLDAESLKSRYAATDDPLLRAYRGTLLRLAKVPGLPASDRMDMHFASAVMDRPLSVAVKLDQIVWARAPIRFDLAGGWTDTPPFTNRYGGSVVNVAVDLNGQSPIQVFVRRTGGTTLDIHSIDLGLTETISTYGELRDYRDPSSPFSLPKAALTLLGLGLGAEDHESLAPQLARSGGGLELTLLCAVPKGSGLGTSSILAGVILAALERFYGVVTSRDDLFLQVLEMEQMLTTGGGWQDQIGGLVGGLKYIESKPTLKPRPVIHQLDPWLLENSECAQRMTLFYTGQTRLAKGLLKDVVDRVNGMSRSYLFTHARIAELAGAAAEAISLRDYPRLARVIRESFRENKLIHASTTNATMDKMISATMPYWSGMKLLGAGGGGFALFLSPDEKAAAELRKILVERFEDDRARLVDFSLNKTGLEVTTS